MKTNVARKQPALRTHEGGIASKTSNEQLLMRSVMSCMLWEKEFYEDGRTIADRIAELVPLVSPEFAAAVAAHARWDMKLRHAPLLVVREMARHEHHKKLVGRLLPDVVGRADEMAEFLAIYWATNGGKKTLSAQVKLGLGRAFAKFNEYELAKYDRDGAVKLRDVLFLSHAKPAGASGKYTKAERADGYQYHLEPSEELYEKVAERTLETPDTWEVALSGGEDKKAAFERLMREKKLGALAFLRNLRNMAEATVDRDLVLEYSRTVRTDMVLPFRYVAAARFVPQWEPMLEAMFFRATDVMPKCFDGKTLVLVDVSGSMDHPLSVRSDMRRLDAACGLAMILRELCTDARVLTFSNTLVEVPARRGFALRDAIVGSQPHGGTYLGSALHGVHKAYSYDRIFVVTDEQSADAVPKPEGLGYMLNVASSRNGVGYGSWTHIDGFSESVVRYAAAAEAEEKR